MKPDDILDRLEKGQIDVAQSLELLRSGSTGGAAAPADEPTRASSGRVLLRPLGAGQRHRPQRRGDGTVRLRALGGSRRAQAPTHPPAPAPPTGDVVRLHVPEPGIAIIAIEDADGNNMLGPRVVEGLERAAQQVRGDDSLRVVVVHGIDTWFCTGGTPEALDAIRAGRASFTDFHAVRLLLDLEVPAVAAMQGHAFGGGLAFGLYADLVVVADESFYAGNFLEHGFTPGMGASHLFPLKLGQVLGTEMLYTARRYSGRELVERGAQLLSEPRERVVDRALALARELAAKPRHQLRLLKRQLTAKTRRELPEVIEAELAMHRELFGAGAPGSDE